MSVEERGRRQLKRELRAPSIGAENPASREMVMIPRGRDGISGGDRIFEREKEEKEEKKKKGGLRRGVESKRKREEGGEWGGVLTFLGGLRTEQVEVELHISSVADTYMLFYD